MTAQNEAQWTTEPPTEEGWYWVRHGGAHDVAEFDGGGWRGFCCSVCDGVDYESSGALKRMGYEFYPVRIKEPNEGSDT